MTSHDATCQSAAISHHMIFTPSPLYEIHIQWHSKHINMNSNQAYTNQAGKIFIVCCHHIKVRTQNNMVENSELRAVIGPQKHKVTGGWGKYYK